MSKNNEIEFNNIVSDILKNDKFIQLKYEVHHGMNRLDHSLNVAKNTYKVAKKLNFKNYKEVTRAALLHDFFTIEDLNGHLQIIHPRVAVKNTKEFFELDERQENVILSHMFPLSTVMPKYKESWLVSTIDKLVAIQECARYKVPLQAGAFMLFVINFLTIPR